MAGKTIPIFELLHTMEVSRLEFVSICFPRRFRSVDLSKINSEPSFPWMRMEDDLRCRNFSKRVEYQHKLEVYYDEEGRLTQYPGKRPMRELALLKIAGCFEPDRTYTEKEVNEIIRDNISFSDIELIRREMFQSKLIGRLRDGSQYWKEG